MINIVRAWVMSLLFVVLCTACQSGGSWQTKSAGRAYEVVEHEAGKKRGYHRHGSQQA